MTMTRTRREVAVSAATRRKVVFWEIGAFFFIMIFGSFFHFIYELSGFNSIAALFGSVNESTWEHLKLFFYPGLAFYAVQHAFIRHEVNNYWLRTAVALALVPVGVITSFYFYLGIALPIYGEGWLWADISTGAFGVLLGNIASYRLLTAPQKPRVFDRIGQLAIVIMLALFLTLTYFPPKFFLFEDFFRYEYNGQYGILDDYTDYLVFER